MSVDWRCPLARGVVATCLAISVFFAIVVVAMAAPSVLAEAEVTLGVFLYCPEDLESTVEPLRRQASAAGLRFVLLSADDESSSRFADPGERDLTRQMRLDVSPTVVFVADGMVTARFDAFGRSDIPRIQAAMTYFADGYPVPPDLGSHDLFLGISLSVIASSAKPSALCCDRISSTTSQPSLVVFLPYAEPADGHAKKLYDSIAAACVACARQIDVTFAFVDTRPYRYGVVQYCTSVDWGAYWMARPGGDFGVHSDCTRAETEFALAYDVLSGPPSSVVLVDKIDPLYVVFGCPNLPSVFLFDEQGILTYYVDVPRCFLDSELLFEGLRDALWGFCDT